MHYEIAIDCYWSIECKSWLHLRWIVTINLFGAVVDLFDAHCVPVGGLEIDHIVAAVVDCCVGYGYESGDCAAYWRRVESPDCEAT